jgi:AAA family ATP:ADP antiporter
MPENDPARPQPPEPPGTGVLARLIHIHRGEGPKVLLLWLNSFLIMFGYYQIKAVRNGLLLAAHPPEIQSYMAIPQAILLVFVVKIFSRLASRWPRQVLITYVTLFCISNLLLFNLMHWAGVSEAVMGLVFFIWIGMYNLLIPAQFWGFANDIYSEAEGKRLFPFIAFGASLGAVLGPIVTGQIVPVLGSYGMMLLAAAILVPCIGLTWAIHRRDLRESGAGREAVRSSSAQEQPLSKSGGFRLIFASRYLLYIALFLGLYNFVNALGEQMFAILQQKMALRVLGTAATGGAELQNYISAAFAGYQSLANIIGLIVQLFLVSRIFHWVGIGGALLCLPLFSLGGYGFLTFGASLLMMKWIKALENGLDYSLMKTARSALFLITSREEKYKAQAAIETFFVRGGDAVCALIVWLGTSVFALSIERFAAVNVIGILILIALGILIIREYKKRKAAGEPAAAAASD